MAGKLLRLNIRGCHFDVKIDNLHRDPSSLLSKLAHGQEQGHLKDNEERFYIDRNACLFHHILDYYSSGVLDFPAQYSWETVEAELQFWNINTIALTKANAARYDAEKDLVKRANAINADWNRYDYMSRGTSCPERASQLRQVWQFVDIPQSSRLSMVCISISQIFLGSVS